MAHPDTFRGLRRCRRGALAALVVAGALLGLLAPAGPVGADDARVAKFPDRLVTIVVPWPAGGRTDAATRIWAPFLEQELGVPVVVANRPGGGGVVGARAVARAGADGYSHGVFSISHSLAQWTKTPPFELEAYTPVVLAFSTPFVLAVKADVPWKNVQDFGAAARAGDFDALIRVLDPDVVVLGGGMSNIARLYDTVPALWGAYVFGATRSMAKPELPTPGDRATSRLGGEGRALEVEPVRTRLLRARHGDSSGVRGAAWLWFDAIV